MPKNQFFRHISGIFRRKKFFFENRAPSLFGHCHFAPLCQKSAKNNEPIPRKAGSWKMVKGNFPKKRKSVIYDEKKFSGKNSMFRSHFRVPCSLSFCQKSEKTNEAICTKSKKPIFRQFFAQIGPIYYFF